MFVQLGKLDIRFIRGVENRLAVKFSSSVIIDYRMELLDF